VTSVPTDAGFQGSVAPTPEATGPLLDYQSLVSHCSQLEALHFRAFSECNAANERLAAAQKELKELQVIAVHIQFKRHFNH
jgi:hypothetical protein